MAYKTVKICWMPRTQRQWQTFTAARREAARLWNDIVLRHARIRRRQMKWPSKGRWERWAKGRYPGLHSQTVQQIIGEFCEAVNATRQLRKNGHAEARYPWRLVKYRDVIYTNQAVRIQADGRYALPNGMSGKLLIKIPSSIELPGRLMEVRLCMGHILFTCEVADEPKMVKVSVGVDLGINTLIAATDGQKALLVSGREAKATVQWRNKNLASIQQRQSKMLKGSRRWKKLQRRKAKMLAKAGNRINDLTHKATTLVKKEFPDAEVIVGQPFNEAAQKIGRVQAQQVSTACNAKIINQLDYKCSGAMVVPEPYSSQTCPVCGRRQKCRRIYRCRYCSYTAPRDVVGAVNNRSIGLFGRIIELDEFKTHIIFKYPVAKRVVLADTQQVARTHPRSPRL